MGPIIYFDAPTTGTVYALVSSDAPEAVYYVGQTKGLPATRLAGHLAEADHPRSTGNPKKTAWIKRVLFRGARVGIRVLGEYPLAELNLKEKQWMLFFLPTGLLTNRDLPHLNTRHYLPLLCVAR
jgi:hypothetical protein